MIALPEAARHIAGAWRLARRDPTGMALLDTSIEGFWRSFWAAALAAPGYAVLVALRLDAKIVEADWLHAVLVEAIAYVVAWTLYPLVAFYLTALLDRRGRYLGYVVAYNWAALIQIAIYVPIYVLWSAELLPSLLMTLIGLAVWFAFMAYHYFIIRTALDVDPGPAVGVVALETVLALLLEEVVRSLHWVGA